MNFPRPSDEPVVYAGTIAGLIAAVFTALQAFGITHLSGAQVEAVLKVAAIVGPIVLALVQRQFVFPASHVEDTPEE